MAEKRILVPMVQVNHNYSDTGLAIDVDLAGASKESVDLEVGNSGFCVKAEGDDFRYDSCYMLGHEVIADQAAARFESGLLRISVPFKETTHGHKVAIE